MNLVTVISFDYDKLLRRVVKFLRMGKTDVRTSVEVAPFGIDSGPLKGMVAIYGETLQNGQTVILGYFNKKQLAAAGEFRTYSMDADGNVKFYTWLKNNGTMELGGAVDNSVRYSKLNDGLQAEVSALNTELGKIQTAITALGGAYVMAPVSVDISASKIDEIKTL